jgi:hypothetical protein
MSLHLVLFAAIQIVSIVVVLAFLLLETMRRDKTPNSPRKARHKPKAVAGPTLAKWR